MPKKYPRTNIYVIDHERGFWAQYRAKNLGYSNVSEYLFKLIELDMSNPDISAIMDEIKLKRS
jgi:hypothetical protein